MNLRAYTLQGSKGKRFVKGMTVTEVSAASLENFWKQYEGKALLLWSDKPLGERKHQRVLRGKPPSATLEPQPTEGTT